MECPFTAVNKDVCSQLMQRVACFIPWRMAPTCAASSCTGCWRACWLRLAAKEEQEQVQPTCGANFGVLGQVPAWPHAGEAPCCAITASLQLSLPAGCADGINLGSLRAELDMPQYFRGAHTMADGDSEDDAMVMGSTPGLRSVDSVVSLLCARQTYARVWRSLLPQNCQRGCGNLLQVGVTL